MTPWYVKMVNEKDGCQGRPYGFQISWHCSYPASGSATSSPTFINGMDKAKARIDEGINGYSSQIANNGNADPTDLSILCENSVYSTLYSDIALTMSCSLKVSLLIGDFSLGILARTYHPCWSLNFVRDSQQIQNGQHLWDAQSE